MTLRHTSSKFNLGRYTQYIFLLALLKPQLSNDKEEELVSSLSPFHLQPELESHAHLG